MNVKPLPWRFARQRNRGTTEIMTRANVVMHVKQQYHQQQPLEALTMIIMIYEHDEIVILWRFCGGRERASVRLSQHILDPV